MTRSSRSTNAATNLAAQVGIIHPWPDLVGAPSPTESILFTSNQRFRSPDDWENRPGDLVELARLCKLQAQAIDCMKVVEDEGPVFTNAKGARQISPYLLALNKMNGDIAVLKRSLGVGVMSQTQKRVSANKTISYDKANETYEGANDLLN